MEGRLERTQRERNETNRHQRALKLMRIYGDPSLREQGVGSSNLPAPTNEINDLENLIFFDAPEIEIPAAAPTRQVFQDLAPSRNQYRRAVCAGAVAAPRRLTVDGHFAIWFLRFLAWDLANLGPIWGAMFQVKN